MACSTLLPPAQVTLLSMSTTKRYTWLTGWMPAMAMDAAAATLKLVGVLGAFRGQPAYQLATARSEKPSAPVAVGSQQTADGEYYYGASDFALDAATPGTTFIRFGIAHDISSSPNQGVADATLQVVLRQCGEHLKAWTGHLQTLTTSNQYVPITGWMPALGVVKVQGTIVVSSLVGNFRVILTYRTATASPESPGLWDSTGIGSAITADGESNTGELAVTTTGKMWIQLGLRYELTSGSALGQADVSVLPGIRHSS